MIELRKNHNPINTISSERWVREQSIVKPCPKCGNDCIVAKRYMMNHGSLYLLVCNACGFKPKVAFSFSNFRGLKRAIRRWNRAKCASGGTISRRNGAQ